MWPFTNSSNSTNPPKPASKEGPDWYDEPAIESQGARAAYRRAAGMNSNNTTSDPETNWLDPQDISTPPTTTPITPTSTSIRGQRPTQTRQYQFYASGSDKGQNDEIAPNDPLFDAGGRFNPIQSHSQSKQITNQSQYSDAYRDHNAGGSVLNRGAAGFRRKPIPNPTFDENGPKNNHPHKPLNFDSPSDGIDNTPTGKYSTNPLNYYSSSTGQGPQLGTSYDSEVQKVQRMEKIARNREFQRETIQQLDQKFHDAEEARFQQELSDDTALWEQKERIKMRNSTPITAARGPNADNRHDDNSAITFNRFPGEDPTAPHDKFGKRLFRRFNTSAATPDDLTSMYSQDADGLPTAAMSFGHWEGVPNTTLVKKTAELDRERHKTISPQLKPDLGNLGPKDLGPKGDMDHHGSESGDNQLYNLDFNLTSHSNSNNSSKGLVPGNLAHDSSRRRSHVRRNLPPNVTKAGQTFTVNPPAQIDPHDFAKLTEVQKKAYQDQLLDFQKFTFRGMNQQQRELMLLAQWNKLSSDQHEECKEFQYLHLNFNTRKRLKHMSGEEKDNFLQLKHFDQQRIFLLQPLSFEVTGDNEEYDQFSYDDDDADYYLEGSDASNPRAKNAFTDGIDRIREIRRARNDFAMKNPGSNSNTKSGKATTRSQYSQYVVNSRDKRAKMMNVLESENDPDGLNATITQMRLADEANEAAVQAGAASGKSKTSNWREALRNYQQNPDGIPTPDDIESIKEQLRNLTPQQQFNILFRQHEKQLLELERFHTAQLHKATDWKVDLLQKQYHDEGGDGKLSPEDLVPLVTNDVDMAQLRRRQDKQRRELIKRQEGEHKQLSNILLLQDKAKKEIAMREHQLEVAKSKRKFKNQPHQGNNDPNDQNGSDADIDEDEVELELRLLEQFRPTFKATGRPLEDEIAQKRKELLWRQQEEEVRDRHRAEALRQAALSREQLEMENRASILQKLEEGRERRDIEYLLLRQRGKMIDLKMKVSPYKYKPKHRYLNPELRRRDDRASYMYKTLGMLLFGVNVRWNGGIINGLLSTMVPQGQVPDQLSPDGTSTAPNGAQQRGYYVDIEHRAMDFSNLWNYYGVAASLYNPAIIPSFSHSLYEDPDLDPMTNPNVIGFDQYAQNWAKGVSHGNGVNQMDYSQDIPPPLPRQHDNLQDDGLPPTMLTISENNDDGLVNNNIAVTNQTSRIVTREMSPEELQELQQAKLREYEHDFAQSRLHGVDYISQTPPEISYATSKQTTHKRDLEEMKERRRQKVLQMKKHGPTIFQPGFELDPDLDQLFTDGDNNGNYPTTESNSLISLNPQAMSTIDDPFGSTPAVLPGNMGVHNHNNQFYRGFNQNGDFNETESDDNDEVEEWVQNMLNYQRDIKKYKAELSTKSPKEQQLEIDRLIQQRQPSERIAMLFPNAQFADQHDDLAQTTNNLIQVMNTTNKSAQQIYTEMVYNTSLNPQEKEQLFQSLQQHQLTTGRGPIPNSTGNPLRPPQVISYHELNARKENVLGRKLVETNTAAPSSNNNKSLLGFNKTAIIPRDDILSWTQDDLAQAGFDNPIFNKTAEMQLSQHNQRNARAAGGGHDPNQLKTSIDSDVRFFQAHVEWDSAPDQSTTRDRRFGTENYSVSSTGPGGLPQWSLGGKREVNSRPGRFSTPFDSTETDIDEWNNLTGTDVVNSKQASGYWGRQTQQRQSSPISNQQSGIATLQNPIGDQNNPSSLRRANHREFLPQAQQLPENLTKDDLKSNTLLKKHGINITPTGDPANGSEKTSWLGKFFG